MPKRHTPKHPLIFQCPLCKDLTELHDFATSPDGITLHCPRCSGEIFLPTASSGDNVPPKKSAKKGAKSKSKGSPKAEHLATGTFVSEEDGAEVEEVAIKAPKLKSKPQRSSGGAAKERCPKCGQLRDMVDENCPRCGLLFANVGKTFDPERFSKPQNAMERSAMALWDEVLDDWDTNAAHERFIQFCNAQNLLELAAHNYRRVKDDEDDERAPVALTHLARILEMVQAHFLANQTRGDAKSTVQRGKWWLMFVLLVFSLFAFYIIWGKMSGSTPLQGQLP